MSLPLLGHGGRAALLALLRPRGADALAPGYLFAFTHEDGTVAAKFYNFYQLTRSECTPSMASAVFWSLAEASSLAEANEELLETWSSSLKKKYGELGNTGEKL